MPLVHWGPQIGCHEKSLWFCLAPFCLHLVISHHVLSLIDPLDSQPQPYTPTISTRLVAVRRICEPHLHLFDTKKVNIYMFQTTAFFIISMYVMCVDERIKFRPMVSKFRAGRTAHLAPWRGSQAIYTAVSVLDNECSCDFDTTKLLNWCYKWLMKTGERYVETIVGFLVAVFLDLFYRSFF